MANGLYTQAKTMILRGQLNWETAPVRVALVNAGLYQPDFQQHQTLADVDEQALVATSPVLANKAVVDGACDADDVVVEAVNGLPVDGLLFYVEGQDPADSALLAWIDTGYDNLPFVPNGGDVRLIWSEGQNRIFRI